MKRTSSPLLACKAALARNLLATSPHLTLDKNGYADEAINNLIEGVTLNDFEADLRQGDGNEMEGKFRAAHSSSALGVNNFAPFKTRIASLRLPSGSDFVSLQFERKCPHGLAGRRSPNLDVLAEAPNGIVAIESKCLEYLTPHAANFAPAYDREIRDHRRNSAWFAEMQKLTQETHRYRWLDAAQLVKHSFGLSHTFPERPVTLLYLFWEPANPEDHSVFAQHRAEIVQFSEAVHSGGPVFQAMSYPELWDFWDRYEDVKSHVARLRARYGASI